MASWTTHLSVKVILWRTCLPLLLQRLQVHGVDALTLEEHAHQELAHLEILTELIHGARPGIVNDAQRAMLKKEVVERLLQLEGRLTAIITNRRSPNSDRPITTVYYYNDDPDTPLWRCRTMLSKLRPPVVDLRRE